MDERTVTTHRNPAGRVWASLGFAILMLTFACVGWIQFAQSFPPEGVFFLLALGGTPAAAALAVGLWRGVRARRTLVSTASGPIHSSGVRVAVAGLALLATGVAIVAGDTLRRHSQNRQWIAEAQAAVEDVLVAADRIPADMRERLGPFQGLSGDGFAGASWNIQGYHYLFADRNGHFANATIPVRIYVTEGSVTNRGSHEIVVQKVERDRQLYLEEAPVPKVPTEGLRITVSHPELKKL